MAALLQGALAVKDAIQERVLHNRWQSELQKYLGDFEEKKEGGVQRSTMPQPEWEYKPTYETVADYYGTNRVAKEGEAVPKGYESVQEFLGKNSPEFDKLNKAEVEDLTEEYRMKVDALKAGYPKEMWTNPFEPRKEPLTFEQRRALKGMGSNPKYWQKFDPNNNPVGNIISQIYAPTLSQKELDAGYRYEGYEKPSARAGIPGKETGGVISLVKLAEKYKEDGDPTALQAAGYNVVQDEYKPGIIDKYFYDKKATNLILEKNGKYFGVTEDNKLIPGNSKPAKQKPKSLSDKYGY